MDPPRISVLGTQLSASTFDAAVEVVADAVRRGAAVFVSPATVYSVMLGFDRPSYREQVNRAAYVCADGMPLVWTLRLRGLAAERVHGDDLFLAICQRYPHWRHYLLGGRSGQPGAVAAALRARVPALTLVGSRATPIRPPSAVESEDIVRAIQASRAQIVWVGMGTPAQDEWMHAYVAKAGVPLVGVGSVFDVLAGVTRPVPRWVQRSGLQWVFRLAQEPQRLWRRYLYYNPRFLWHLARELRGLRRTGSRPARD